MLLSSIPSVDETKLQERIEPIGEPPSPIYPPSGCRFLTRCPYAMSECKQTSPKQNEMGELHGVSCHLFDEAVMDDEDPPEAIRAGNSTEVKSLGEHET